MEKNNEDCFDLNAVLASYSNLKQMTEEQLESVNKLEESLFTRLQEGLLQLQPSEDVTLEIAELHKRWLCFYWQIYTYEAHEALSNMYLKDERFQNYYDEKVGQGATNLLVTSIISYVNR